MKVQYVENWDCDPNKYKKNSYCDVFGSLPRGGHLE